MEDTLRSLVSRAADLPEPSVTSGSAKEIAWLPSDDDFDFIDF